MVQEDGNAFSGSVGGTRACAYGYLVMLVGCGRQSGLLIWFFLFIGSMMMMPSACHVMSQPGRWMPWVVCRLCMA